MKLYILLLITLVSVDVLLAQENDIIPAKAVTIRSMSGGEIYVISDSARGESLEAFGPPQRIEKRGDWADMGYYDVFCYDGLELYFHDDSPNKLLGFEITSENYSINAKNNGGVLKIGMKASRLKRKYPNSMAARGFFNGKIGSREYRVVINLGMDGNTLSDDNLLVTFKNARILSISRVF